ncbi:MAG: hypothetical protein AAF808_05245 [Cyanobacteria bacterium P01_D01_bin.2]
MKKRTGLGVITLAAGLCCWLPVPGHALPGYSVDEVRTWMQGHPTLRADRREGLRIHRTDVPSRRFTFQASVFPVGGFRRPDDAESLSSSIRNQDFSVIRREEFLLVDYDQPVTLARLEEALRTIYGPDIHADYRRAPATYGYIATETTNSQGEVRSGNLYTYWIELAVDTNGVATAGKLNVLLSEDTDRLESYLQALESIR